jgi:hypothetical protein
MPKWLALCVGLLLAVVLAAPAWGTDTTLLLPKGAVIETHLAEEMNSAKVHAGDSFQFVVAKDVVVDHNIVISTGSKGSGHLTEVTAAGSSGKSGGIALVYDYVTADNGTQIPVLHDTTEKKKDVSTAGGTVGGAAAGWALLGVGGSALGGLFGHKAVHGQNVVIPVTTITEVATQSDYTFTLNNRVFPQARTTDSPASAAISPAPATRMRAANIAKPHIYS